MAFCSLCQSIPFSDLPEFSPALQENLALSGIANIEEFFFRTEPKDEPLGFPHQPSIEVLAESAASCELCNLIHESASLFMAAYQKAMQDPLFIHYNKKDELVPTGLPLWLTRRLDDGDGFLVFTYSQSGNTIFLVGAVGFCAEEDSPLASYFCGRPVQADPISERTLSRAASWVHECLEKHENCFHADNVELPSRLLDLDSSPNPDEIKLWETEGAHGRYATLSHCWGKSAHFTTTQATLESRKQGIVLAELPKTFLDAIMIARGLSIRYLWIDSLCICQDDAQDWERESATMTAVYSNSFLTIAATCAENNSAGISRSIERRHNPFHFTMDNGTNGQLLAFRLPLPESASYRRYVEMLGQPLTLRAWALQERTMSQRVLHFCYDQMYYECNDEFRSEDGLRIKGRFDAVPFNPKQVFGIEDGSSRHSKELSLWCNVLWDYTSRKLTVASDKLPALSGLARLFSERINADYVAGLWSNALIEGLTWQPLGDRNPLSSTYVAPSWSWASYNGIAATGSSGWKELATVIDYNVSLKGPNQFGEVTDGWIRLRAPLIPLTMGELPVDCGVSWQETGLRTPWGNAVGAHASFDHGRSRDEVIAMNLPPLFALVLEWIEGEEGQEGEEDEKQLVYQSLIVASDGSGNERMKRLGVVWLERESLGNLSAVQDSTQFAVVTLV